MTAKLDQIDAIQRARQLLQKQPVYLDTETTGTGPAAEIIEIAVVDHDGSLLYESLVKPKGQIEPDAMRVHGITLAQLEGAPTWKDVWPQVEAALAGRQVGVYNSEFDLRMMRQSHQKYWLSWQFPESNVFCIMKLYARFYGAWDARRGSYRWQSLDQAGQQCRITLPNSHRAADDARLARALLQHIAGAQFS
jgi:DNA polymerase III epsilon subunit-like protein